MIDKEKAKIYKLNSQNIELKACYFKQSDEECVICIPGLGGTFSGVFEVLAEDCIQQGMSFLFAYNQGSYTEKELKKYSFDGSYEKVKRGACYEDMDNIIPDLDCWISFVLEQGYSKIYLVGASLGCDKIVKYITEKPISKLQKIVFMCPQDISYRCDEDMLSEACQNINNNQPLKILSKQFLGFTPITSRSFFDLFSREDVHNFMYMHDEGKFENLQKINVPVFCIIGTCDQGFGDCENPEIHIKKIQSNIKNCELKLIDGAKHSFKGYEQVTANEIINFLMK